MSEFEIGDAVTFVFAGMPDPRDADDRGAVVEPGPEDCDGVAEYGPGYTVLAQWGPEAWDRTWKRAEHLRRRPSTS